MVLSNVALLVDTLRYHYLHLLAFLFSFTLGLNFIFCFFGHAMVVTNDAEFEIMQNIIKPRIN